ARFSDKEQIWADNAASSPFFGDVYVCSSAFEGTSGGAPLVVSVSRDGGNTWTSQEVTKGISNAPHGYRTGCTIRSDSHGVVYLAVTHFATPTAARTFPFAATPGIGSHELLKSFDGGKTWTKPISIITMNDGGFYAAPAISPNGRDLYVVYNAFTMPFRNNTTSSRSLVGVVTHADIGVNGVPGTFGELHRGVSGDPRGSSANSLVAEFLGDYVYAIATNTYGAGVWNDVRNAADCPAIDA